jgi:predicted permease
MLPDLVRAFRSLRRDRAFTAFSLSLLALTCGATIALFAVVRAVVLQPLPFAEPHRTTVIWEYDTTRSTPVVEVGLGEATDWLADGSPIESVAVFSSVAGSVTLVRDGVRSRATSTLVSRDFFTIVGAQPLLGRLLSAVDEADDTPRTAVISEGYWRRAFGGDPAVVGRVETMQWNRNSRPGPIEIVGVLPATFDLPRHTDVWLAAAPALRAIASSAPGDRTEALTWYLRYYKIFYALGRLRDDIDVREAELQLSAIVRQRELPTGRPSGVVLTLLRDYLLGTTQPILWVMLAGAALMLLLACSSVAALQVFRLAKQDRALAVQMALGAERRRLTRHALAECGLLAGGGAICATVAASGLTRVLIALAPGDVPRLDAATVLDGPTLLAAGSLAMGATVVSGLWPVAFVARVDPSRVLTAGTRTAMLPRERALQRLVVGWQVAMAVVLLSGAALFIRSVEQLNRVPLGFDANGLISIELQPSVQGMERWDQFFATVLEQLRALPGIQGAAAIALRPLSGPIGNDSIPVLYGQEGLGPDAPWRRNPRSNLQAVTPGYFAAVGTRVLSGRDFTGADVAPVENVVIVGASTAARLWPGSNPIGQRMLVPTQRQPGSLEVPRWQTVVGVVEDVRYRGITDPRLDVYLPAAQSTIRVAYVMVRTSAPTAALVAELTTIVRKADAGAIVADIESLPDAVMREIAPWRFAMRVLTAFGTLAAVLAVTALVGLLALAVALRRRELGIRAALGATPGRLHVHVLAEAVWIGGLATGIGVVAAVMVGRGVGPLLVNTPPDDPAAILGATIVTLLVAACGCFWVGHRAAQTEPLEALREY